MKQVEWTRLRVLAAKTLIDGDDLTPDEQREWLKALAHGVLTLSSELEARIATNADPQAFFKITEDDVWPGQKHIVRPPPKEYKKYTRRPRGTYDRNAPVRRVK